MRMRGDNYFKVINMKLGGISSNHISRELNLSRERVRQLWVSYQTINSESDFRICSKCNKKFLPTYRFQSTCGCYVSPFAKCINCGKRTQFLKGRRRFSICTDSECIKNRNITKTRNRKLSIEKRDRVKVEVTCTVCGIHHIIPRWKVRRRNFRMRCEPCSNGQRIGLCGICKKPISGPNGRCRKHAKRKSLAAKSRPTPISEKHPT